MKKYEDNIWNLPAWEDYLFEVIGDKEITKERRNAIRKEYKKLYHRKYRLKRKVREVRLVVTLPMELYGKLERLLVEYKAKSLPDLIRKVLRDFAHGTHDSKERPEDKKIAWLVRKAGNNINQIVYKIHAEVKYQTLQGSVDGVDKYRLMFDGYKQLLKEVMALEKMIKEGRRMERETKESAPKSNTAILRSLLDEKLEGDALKVEVIMRSIERLKKVS